jgi:putative lipoprotein
VKPTRILIMLGLGSMFLAGCGDSSEPIDNVASNEEEAGPKMKILEGEAFYRERIALPPGALLNVVLEDVSRMDVPATVLAEYSVSLDTSPPYAFELEYDPAMIEDRMRYSVRARITEGERLRFISTSSTDPFKLPEGEPLSILMSSAGGGRGGQAATAEPDRDMRAVVSRNPQVEMEGTHWRLESLGGQAVTQPEDSQREAFLMLDADRQMAGGFGSCNGFRGSYRLNGNEISLGPLAGTLKMCADFMELERGFMDALAATAWYSIQESRLVLLDGEKNPLATFTAVTP